MWIYIPDKNKTQNPPAWIGNYWCLLSDSSIEKMRLNSFGKWSCLDGENYLDTKGREILAWWNEPKPNPTPSEITNLVNKVAMPGEIYIPRTIRTIDKVIKIQKKDGYWNQDPYNHGVLNSLILAKAILELEDNPKYVDAPDKWLCESKIPGSHSASWHLSWPKVLRLAARFLSFLDNFRSK